MFRMPTPSNSPRHSPTGNLAGNLSSSNSTETISLQKSNETNLQKNYWRLRRQLTTNQFWGYPPVKAITANLDSGDGQRYEALISRIQTQKDNHKILLKCHGNRKIQQSHRQINDWSNKYSKRRSPKSKPILEKLETAIINRTISTSV